MSSARQNERRKRENVGQGTLEKEAEEHELIHPEQPVRDIPLSGPGQECVERPRNSKDHGSGRQSLKRHLLYPSEPCSRPLPLRT